MPDFSECPLRIQLILSILSGKPIKLRKIRSDEEEPGLKDYEVDLLKLLDKITNGSRTDINETGTSLTFIPGLLIGGTLAHDCCKTRGIGFYLEVLMCLAPFTKQPLEITLSGVTNDPLDLSIDHIRYSSIPVLKRFIGVDEGLELKLIRRGAKPEGGGQILFKCPTRMKLLPVNLTDPGKIKRIRGIAYAMRVAPAICNRMVETAKGVLLKFIPDVYIVSDHQKAVNAGNSPAFGLTLVAETINGTFLCAEACSQPKGSVTKGPNVPEEIAMEATNALLEEIYRGGCVDSANQSMAFLFMALNQKDVSKILTGILSPYSISFLRNLKSFFDIMFKIEPFRNQELNPKASSDEPKRKKKKKDRDGEKDMEDEEEERKEKEEEERKEKEKREEIEQILRLGHEKLVISCLGIGFTNLTKTLI